MTPITPPAPIPITRDKHLGGEPAFQFREESDRGIAAGQATRFRDGSAARGRAVRSLIGRLVSDRLVMAIIVLNATALVLHEMAPRGS
jgi:hypothetical protein